MPGAPRSRLLHRADGSAAPCVLYTLDRAPTDAPSVGVVGLWAEVFDDAYGDAAADPTFNLAGWRSRISGDPFTTEEMTEWLGNTLNRVTALNHRRVLEIGCGTGLLMWRLLPTCDSYHGTDISDTAIRALRDELTARSVPHATVECEEAVRTPRGFPAEVDLVLLNSVSQYLPDADYLRDTLDGALGVLADGGSIFVGDVRNADLLDAFALACAGSGGSVLARRQRLRQTIAAEPELLVSPLWFSRYAEQRHLTVQALPKLGRGARELNGFRYDVVLSRRAPGVASDAVPVLPWEGTASARRALRPGKPVIFRGVPHPGVTDLAERAYQLLYGAGTTPVGVAGVHPADLAAAFGEFQISLLGGAWGGAYDLAVGPGAGRVRMPDARTVRQRLALVPRHHAGRRPSAAGQIDRRPDAIVAVTSLAEPLPRPFGWEARAVFAPVRTTAQRRLAELWQASLGVTPIGAHDSFPALGGTAELAREVSVAAARQGLRFDPGDLMAGRSLAELSG